MRDYKVTIKGTSIKKEVQATTELHAKVLFCISKNLDYRLYANKLVVSLIKKQKGVKT